jgi:ribose transport system permease protein
MDDPLGVDADTVGGGGAALRFDRFRALRLALWALRAGPALILGLVVVAVALSTPLFLTSQNIGNVLAQSAVIAILALGQLLVILTRGIDLSVGSTLALSTVVGAVVFEHATSGPLVIAVIVGTGVAVGTLNGLIFVVGRVPHPFIVTLATLSVARGLAFMLSDGRPMPGMPEAVQVVGGDSIDWLPYSTFVVAGAAIAVVVLTARMVWGRWIYAVGGNPDGARRSGIPVSRVLISVYVISGAAAGVAAVLTAGRTNAGSPNFGELAELDSIAAVIIGGAAFSGGRGNVANALVGALMIGVIRNALNLHNADAFYQLIVIGIVIVVAVEADVLRAHLETRFRVASAARLG